MELPAGWSASPADQTFKIDKSGNALTLRFQVTPPSATADPTVRAVATVNGAKYDSSVVVIHYPHIPTQTVMQPASTRFTRADVRVLAKTVGYIQGAGDDVPAALRQMGCEVQIVTPEELAAGSLDHYDSIVTGVRAFNVREDLRANVARLNEYVRNGGTLVVQYNTYDDALGQLGPYSLKLGRGRVAVEEAPIRVLQPDSPILRGPTRLPRATSMAGCKSEGSTSRRNGIRNCRLSSHRMIRGRKNSQAGSCTGSTAKAHISIRLILGSGSCPRVCRERSESSQIY